MKQTGFIGGCIAKECQSAQGKGEGEGGREGAIGVFELQYNTNRVSLT